MTIKKDAWKWLRQQVRGEIDNSDWRNMDAAGGARRKIAEALRDVAMCEYPLDAPPQIAGDLVQMPHVAVALRMERRGWALKIP